MIKLLEIALYVLCFLVAVALVAAIVFIAVFLRWLCKEVDDGQEKP